MKTKQRMAVVMISKRTQTNVKSFPSHKTHKAYADFRFLSPQPDCQTSVYTTRPQNKDGASASCGVLVYVPAFAGTRCAYSRRDGQAELTWVAGYIRVPRRFIRLLTVTPIQVLTGSSVD